MGCYSWMYCDSKERMICGKRKDSFLLIPAEFGGGHIIEHCYSGYGQMGTVDIYEIVAWWNKKYLTTDMIEMPSRSSWANTEEGQKWYERAMATYKYECQRLQDFVDNQDEEYMVKNYGSDW